MQDYQFGPTTTIFDYLMHTLFRLSSYRDGNLTLNYTMYNSFTVVLLAEEICKISFFQLFPILAILRNSSLARGDILKSGRVAILAPVAEISGGIIVQKIIFIPDI